MTNNERRDRYASAMYDAGDEYWEMATAAMAVADEEITRALAIADAAHDAKMRDMQGECTRLRAELSNMRADLEKVRAAATKAREWWNDGDIDDLIRAALKEER